MVEIVDFVEMLVESNWKDSSYLARISISLDYIARHYAERPAG